MIGSAAPFAAMLFWAPSAQAAPVRSGEAACALAETRVAAHLHRARPRIAGCETILSTHTSRGFYTLGLHGRCRETVCGSTLVGWYAVGKRTGRVFEWDVAEWRLGLPIG
jgi:hypothetical protein